MLRRAALLAAIAALAACLLLPACRGAVSDAVSIATNPSGTTAARVLARRGAAYAANPAQLQRDARAFREAFEQIMQALQRAAGGEWGRDEAETPEPKKYVKYTQNYKSRAMVDFDQGLVTVETVDQETPRDSLHTAIVTTLLTPDDPRAVDLFSSEPVKLGDTPYLLGEVKDHDDKDIRWEWRAGRYADWLLANRLDRREVRGGETTARRVTFPMVEDHVSVRAAKYDPLVRKNAERWGVSRNLIYSIMRVESNFNPYAVSHAPAFGLMQVVPTTAGADVYRHLHGHAGIPGEDELLRPETNILYGTAYLNLLDTRYLDGVAHPVSREYAVISGYNGGAGSVLRMFASTHERAFSRINALDPDEVYRKLRHDHPYAETRRYLWKVVQARKEFVRP
ncbi:murein transglycosylase domain-containing protein [Desulfohalovibrio reitneri]|uniref:murein transglycosylase domain-containing protein n=1 Tax=Desulfohalovibrio reitneri TaxID=1307759 RepID=UPI00068B683E|nr:murein transglycosylase domain-containing protein [Desulfohalovibrio reitneri]